MGENNTSNGHLDKKRKLEDQAWEMPCPKKVECTGEESTSSNDEVNMNDDDLQYSSEYCYSDFSSSSLRSTSSSASFGSSSFGYSTVSYSSDIRSYTTVNYPSDITSLSTEANSSKSINQQPGNVSNDADKQPAIVSNGAYQQPAIVSNGAYQQPAIVSNGADKQPAKVSNGADKQPANVLDGAELEEGFLYSNFAPHPHTSNNYILSSGRSLNRDSLLGSKITTDKEFEQYFSKLLLALVARNITI